MTTSTPAIVGLDIGDGESALSSVYVPSEGPISSDSAQLFVRSRTGERTVVTAMARSPRVPHNLLIGEDALNTDGALQFAVNFKYRPSGDTFETPPSVLFAQALLQEYFTNSSADPARSIVYVGHPAGWPKDSVEAYRRYFLSTGLDIRLMPESQSALVHVRDRMNGREAVIHRVLVIDIGSSTTDLTFVEDMQPRNLEVGTDIGGRQIDEAMVERVIGAMGGDPAFAQALSTDGGLDYLRLVARRAKETYFSGARPRLYAIAGRDKVLMPIVDSAQSWLRALDVHGLVFEPDGWGYRFENLLLEARDTLTVQPSLIVLTGGGSRMTFVRDIVQRVFPEAKVEDDPEPSYSVARGLASNGRHWVNVDRFRADMATIARDSNFDEVVVRALDDSVARVRNELDGVRKRQGEKAALARAKELQSANDDKFSDGERVDQFNREIYEYLEPRIVEICTRYELQSGRLSLTQDTPGLGAAIRKDVSTCRWAGEANRLRPVLQITWRQR